jgi:hypothetical protein
MADEPKFEDFPSTIKWLEALEKFGATQRAKNPIRKKGRRVKVSNSADPKAYDSSTQYSRFKTGAPVNPAVDDSNWEEYSKKEKKKKWGEYRKNMRAWKKIQRRAGTDRQKDKYGYSLTDRAEAGNLFGNLSNDQLARRLARSGVKNRHRIREEFQDRSQNNPRLYEMLAAEKNKEDKRDKSKDIVLRGKKSGGKVYGNSTRKSNYKAG